MAHRLRDIAVLRYLDDIFSAETEAAASHAMNTFARSVVALMGETAVSKRKLESGNPLTILVDTGVDMGRHTVCPGRKEGFQIRIETLHAVRREGTLAPGDASKMAGRLSFAAQHMYMGIGRAMLKPVFLQQHSTPSSMKVNRAAVCLQVVDRRPHLRPPLDLPSDPTERSVVDILCDARGSPPRIAQL